MVLRAYARDPEGIARVEFFAEGALIGGDATAPYVARVPASARNLVAIAWDRAGNLTAAAPETARSRR